MVSFSSFIFVAAKARVVARAMANAMMKKNLVIISKRFMDEKMHEYLEDGERSREG